MNILKSSLLIAALGVMSVSAAEAKETVKLKIKAVKVACNDNKSQQCLSVKEGCKSWKTLSSHIEGFNYEPGTSYTIKALKKASVQSAVSGVNTNKYELLKVIKSKSSTSSSSNQTSTSQSAVALSPYKLMIKKVNGTALKTNEPFIVFDSKQGRFHGNAGCNSFNGGFTQKSNALTLGQMMMTMKGCMDPNLTQAEGAISNALANVTLTYHETGNQVWLADANGKKVLEMEKQTPEIAKKQIEGQKWKLITLNGVGQDYGDIHVQFDFANSKVVGFSGCNGFNASTALNEGTIQIGKIMTTMRGCIEEEKNKIESEMQSSLNDKTFTYDVNGDVLTLIHDNRMIAVFRK